jgi:hypothetical protein
MQWRWHRGVCTAELESDNARLWSKHEQAHQVLAEADAAQSSLSADREKLERECAGLHMAVDTLKEEKIQVLTDREAAIAVEQKKFWDYCIGHRKRLRELCVALEGALNEIGMHHR